MKKKISVYEYNQINNFIEYIYLINGTGLDEEECREECWIAYLEGKELYPFHIYDESYWNYIEKKLVERINKIKKIRSEKYGLESKLSLNKRYGEYREEIGTMIPGRTGDFVNGIALWDYSKRLGKLKYSIIKLLYEREEEKDIMNVLKLSEVEFYVQKKN